jgi:hypothetical protein
MTTMNLYIRKHTFNETFTSKYFFNFFTLLEEDIPQALVDKLVMFFEKSNRLREETKEKIHPSSGNSMIVFSAPDKSYGFTAIGFVDHDYYKNVFLTLEHRLAAIESLNALYDTLEWQVSPTRRAEISNLSFNNETQKYNIDISFDDIENLYESSNLTDE